MAISIAPPPGDVGVIVGRFQVHELHPGHRELIQWLVDNYNTTLVILGEPSVPLSRSNPLPWRVRERMIAEAFPEVIVDRVFDTRDDESWSRSLDSVIEMNLRPGQKPVLFGSRDSFIPFYSGKYPTQELTSSESFWSGTEVRERIAGMSPSLTGSKDFRAGVIWASGGSYPRVVPTVDIAVQHNTRPERYCMIRKAGERGWRFPGGFCEPGKSFEVNAVRELHEECGPLEIADLRYVGSYPIDDWRYRSGPDGICTTLFHARHVFGNPVAGDDAMEAEWLDLSDRSVTVVPEHRPLVHAIRSQQFTEVGNGS